MIQYSKFNAHFPHKSVNVTHIRTTAVFSCSASNYQMRRLIQTFQMICSIKGVLAIICCDFGHKNRSRSVIFKLYL